MGWARTAEGMALPGAPLSSPFPRVQQALAALTAGPPGMCPDSCTTNGSRELSWLINSHDKKLLLTSST